MEVDTAIWYDPDGAAPEAPIDFAGYSVIVSSDDSVLSVDCSGHAHGLCQVTAEEAGTATLYAYTWGAVSETVDVEVLPTPEPTFWLERHDREARYAIGETIDYTVWLDPDGEGPAEAMDLTAYHLPGYEERTGEVSMDCSSGPCTLTGTATGWVRIWAQVWTATTSSHWVYIE